MLAVLEQRTLGFVALAHKVTRDPVWAIVPRLRHPDPADPALRALDPDHWARWSPVVRAATLDRALVRLHPERHHAPSWVVLALAAHKVRSPTDAQSVLYDLALPLTAPASTIDAPHALPLLVLTAHALAYFSLAPLLRPLTSRFIDLPPHAHTFKSFHFNMLLQAVSLFDRSPLAADVAIDVLTEMESRRLALWSDTERVLIRDNFRTPQLLDHFRRRRSPNAANQARSEAWLRAYASFGRVQPSASCLHAIRKQCLENGVPPPYPTEDAPDPRIQGTPHKANTHYLRSMRDDRQSAFRYFHHLLKLDLSRSRQPLPPSLSPASAKSNIDIYDWTTALYAGAHDRTLSANALLDLFDASRQGTNAYRPTRATYSVIIRGLLWRDALEDAEKLWDEFVREVVASRSNPDGESEMRIDRKALCVGIDVLVKSGRAEEALYLLEEAVKRDVAQVTAWSRPSLAKTSASPYLKVHPVHVLLTALLRIRRPDVIFFVWTHLTSLYFVPPTDLMLRILLKAAMQASKMDGETLKGAMHWYIADNRLFKKQGGPIAPTMTPYEATASSHEADNDPFSSDRDPRGAEQTSGETGSHPCRETFVAHLRSLFQAPTPPPVVGIWANRRSTEVARSVFRGMVFGNWPALQRATGASGGGVTTARARGGESVFQELARVLEGDPGRFLPPLPPHLGAERPTMARAGPGDEQMGPPLPTVMPSERTFAAYIALLGLASRADEIPEALVWMRALGVVPRTETLSVALVFWMEVGLRGPVFEDGWVRRVPGGNGDAGGGDDAPPRTEYGALRAWIRAWVGEGVAPTEADICAGIKRVREMRDGGRN